MDAPSERALHPAAEGEPPGLQLPAAPVPAATDVQDMVLACQRCRFPIASRAELIIERSTGLLDSAVFAYELDVLGSPHWCYSATNPGAARFDVVRVSLTTDEDDALATSAIRLGAASFSGEHSWFPTERVVYG